MELTKKNRKKYVFTCTAPKELTDYNKEWNARIKGACRKPKVTRFEPHPGICLGCPYLEIKGLK